MTSTDAVRRHRRVFWVWVHVAGAAILGVVAIVAAASGARSETVWELAGVAIGWALISLLAGLWLWTSRPAASEGGKSARDSCSCEYP